MDRTYTWKLQADQGASRQEGFENRVDLSRCEETGDQLSSLQVAQGVGQQLWYIRECFSMWSQRIRTKRWQSLTTLNVLYDPCLAKNCDTGSKEKRRQREEKTNQNKSLDFTREMFTMLKRCQSRASDLQLLQTSMICNCPQQFFRHCHHLEFLRIFFLKGWHSELPRFASVLGASWWRAPDNRYCLPIIAYTVAFMPTYI